jgi:hypothetical protein
LLPAEINPVEAMAIQVVNPILRAPALTAWPPVAVVRVAMVVAVAVAVEAAVMAVETVAAADAHSAAEQRQC